MGSTYTGISLDIIADDATDAMVKATPATRVINHILLPGLSALKYPCHARS